MKNHRIRVEYFLVLLFLIVCVVFSYISFESVFIFDKLSQMKNSLSSKSSRKLLISISTSTTHNFWLSKIKDIAIRSRVWEYVDLNKSESKSLVLKYSKLFDYIKIVLVLVSIHSSASTQDSLFMRTILDDSISLVLFLESCSKWNDLFESQQKSYDIKKRKYRNVQLEVVRIIIVIEKIHTIILKSANIYIVMNMRSASVREIFQFLTHKFKMKSKNVRRQIHRRYIYLFIRRYDID